MRPSPHTPIDMPNKGKSPSFRLFSLTGKITSLLSAFPNLAFWNRGSSASAADTRYTLGKKLLFHKRPSFFASESFLKARLGNPFSLVSSLSSLFTYLFHFFPSLLKKTAYFVRRSRNPDLLGSDEIGKSGREAEGNFPQEKIQPRLPKEKLSYRSSFTLIELLIVIAILVILAVVVILTLNPSELLAQSRDSARLSDMASLNSAINIYLVDSAGTGFLGTSSVVYVSLPDTASSTCGDLGLPPLPSGYSYNCVSTTSLVKTDGTGWLPVKLASTSSGTPLGSLPKDPTNTTSSGLYYTYVTDGNGNYELTMVPESQKYASAAATDGGIDPAMYETGNKLTLSPFAHGMVQYEPINEGSGLTIYDKSGFDQLGNATSPPGYGGFGGYWTTSNCMFGGSCLYFSSSTKDVIYVSDVYNFNGKFYKTSLVWFDPSWYNGELEGQTTDILTIQSDQSLAANTSNPCRSNALDIPINTWSMVGYVFDGVAGRENLYLNGQLVKQCSIPAGTTITEIYAERLIGGYDSGWSNQGYAGIISDVRLYDKPLTASQIQAIYNAKQ